MAISQTEVHETRPNNFNPIVEVAATYVIHAGKILLLEIGESKREKGTWGVPAGKLEPGESPLYGAKRELFEETGVNFIPKEAFRPFGQLFVRNPEVDFIYHLFGLQVPQEVPISLSKEHSAYRWVSREEAEKMPLIRGGKEALYYFYQRIAKKRAPNVYVNVYLFLRKEEEILLYFRKKTGYFDNLWGLVSGHVEEGESAISAIIREAYEEAGIVIDPASLHLIYTLHRRSDRTNIDLFFESNSWEGTVLNGEPEKCGALQFFSIFQLPENIVPYIQEVLQSPISKRLYAEIGWSS